MKRNERSYGGEAKEKKKEEKAMMWRGKREGRERRGVEIGKGESGSTGWCIYTSHGSPSVRPTPARRGRNKQPWKRIVKIDGAAISSSSILPRHKRSAMLGPALFFPFLSLPVSFFPLLLSFSLAGPELNLDFYFIEIYCCQSSRASRRLVNAAGEGALPPGTPRASPRALVLRRVYFLPDGQA